MSEPLHKRMFRKHGKDRCRMAAGLLASGQSEQWVAQKMFPETYSRTSVQAVRAMAKAWGEYDI